MPRPNPNASIARPSRFSKQPAKFSAGRASHPNMVILGSFASVGGKP
jgi:hypothetical protein